MKIEIVPVWKALSPELAAELVAFWRDQNAIQNEAAATRRTEQAVCIARDADGALCGVATAMIKVLPRLRHQFGTVDANTNDAIETAEYGNLKLVQNAGAKAPQMSVFDANRDGKLGFGESVTLVQALAPEAGKAAAE